MRTKNCKMIFISHQSSLIVLQNQDEAKEDTANVSVWIFEIEEQLTVDASLLGKSNGAGSYGNAIEDALCVVLSTAEAQILCVNSVDLNRNGTYLLMMHLLISRPQNLFRKDLTSYQA